MSVKAGFCKTHSDLAITESPEPSSNLAAGAGSDRESDLAETEEEEPNKRIKLEKNPVPSLPGAEAEDLGAISAAISAERLALAQTERLAMIRKERLALVKRQIILENALARNALAANMLAMEDSMGGLISPNAAYLNATMAMDPLALNPMLGLNPMMTPTLGGLRPLLGGSMGIGSSLLGTSLLGARSLGTDNLTAMTLGAGSLSAGSRSANSVGAASQVEKTKTNANESIGDDAKVAASSPVEKMELGDAE